MNSKSELAKALRLKAQEFEEKLADFEELFS